MFRATEKKLAQRDLAARQDVLAICEKHGCKITADEKECVMQLSEAKFGIFEECVRGLAAAELLHQASFKQLYSRQLFHLAKVKPSTVMNKRRFLRTNSGTTLYLQAKKNEGLCGAGNFAEVEEAYREPPKNKKSKPVWALKTLYHKARDSHDEIPLAERIKKAKREVRCNRIVGRSGFFFHAGGDVVMALNWMPGVTLYSLKNKILNFTFKQRLSWCIDLLADLTMLHQEFIAHHDIHSDNVVIDLKAGKAAIIDLGMAGKTGPGWQEMRTDMMAFETNILAFMLFKKEYSEGSGKHYDFIKKLSDAIHAPFATCTSLQALNYCKRIAENLGELSAEKIHAIALETLDRKNLEVNDVLCGSNRPKAMRKML